jgi:glutamine synthetase
LGGCGGLSNFKCLKIQKKGNDVTLDLASLPERGIKYFMISYTDLFGGQRAKLVPTQAIADMQENGAGFAGFATWLDLTPAHPDLFAVPDASSVIQLPWKKDVAWVAADCVMEDKPVEQAPRVLLKKLVAEAAEQGLRVKTGVEPEFFLISPDGSKDFRRVRYRRKALLRPAGRDAPLRRHRRNLRLHARTRLEAVPERP